jgi:hydroxymethylbilane synthase
VGVELDEGKDPAGEPIDATVMALAGLARLGLDGHASEILSAEEFLPAPAQGALAIQIRTDDARAAEALAPLDHAPTRRTTQAERAFLATMEGGCHVPLGAFAQVEGRDRIRLRVVVVDPDGADAVRGERVGSDPVELGLALAEELRDQGADEILARLADTADGEEARR